MTMMSDTARVAARIAARLSPGQRSTIIHMDERPVMLGCGEACAIRLAKAARKRPALVVRTEGASSALFALNGLGMAVKAELEASA